MIMMSPHPCTDREKDISCHSADGVQQKIVHVKTSHPGEKLERLHAQTQSKTVEQRGEKTPVFTCHRHEKPEGYEDENISKEIGENGEHTQLLPVSPEAVDLFEEHQIIMVLLHHAGPAVPLWENKKIYDKKDIQDE